MELPLDEVVEGDCREVLARLQNRSAQDTAGMLVEQSGAPWTRDVTVLVARAAPDAGSAG